MCYLKGVGFNGMKQSEESDSATKWFLTLMMNQKDPLQKSAETAERRARLLCEDNQACFIFVNFPGL